ncbi:MAG TPA: glycosyltransferase family 4 protein [Candidatus Peribacteria bacterium]|nr:glycosyltransferase family 4 protein [Candidatus Peribacteria bacterium]
MKKRIVILSAFLSPHRSGAEAMVEEVSARLKDDEDITIVTCLSDARLPKGLPRKDMVGGVAVVRTGWGLGFDKYLFPILGPLAARKLKPQIVHAVLESYAGLALVFCRFLVPSARRMLTLQSTNTSLLLGVMHRAAHKVTAISSALIRRAETLGRNDVELIPNGVPLKTIRDACAFHKKIPGRVLSLSRLEPMKGVETLIAAFAAVLPDVPTNTHLRIVGDGSSRAGLEHQVRVLGIQDRVTFTGRVAPSAAYDEFAQAEVFGGLSRSEAFGNVFVEAQAAGCAVVATNVGGIPDIVTDQVNGLLVPPDDVIAAAAAFKRVLTDTVLRQTLSSSARQDKDRYDWSIIAKKYATVYDAL